MTTEARKAYNRLYYQKNTVEHWAQIEQFYINAARLTRETGIPNAVDHIMPLKGNNLSGLHVPWNLQILTKSENSKKHNKVPK